MELRPQRRENDREPAYRVVVAAPHGDIELGAAWQRESDRGRQYLSVLLDDPSLEHSLSAALFLDKDGKANLVWTRPAKQVAETAPAPRTGGGRRPAPG